MPSFGDVYLVNFEPSIGREYKKVRPALVVQEESVSRDSPYITVMPISSKLARMYRPDILVVKDSKNRLACDGVIKVRQISSFDKARFIRRIGAMGSPTVRQVRGYIRRHFGL